MAGALTSRACGEILLRLARLDTVAPQQLRQRGPIDVLYSGRDTNSRLAPDPHGALQVAAGLHPTPTICELCGRAAQLRG